MSEGGGGGGHDGVLWELNQSWGFSNSDDSTGSEEKSGKKIPESSSNSQTDIGMEKAAPPRKKKRGPDGTDSKDGKRCGSQGKEEGKAGGESDHEIHIWTERERRKKMRNMFANLHALLPQLPSKADKSTIVDEAVNYIKTLQQTLQKLQKQKLERLQLGAATFGFEPTTIAPQKPSCDSREAFLADQGSSNNLATIAIHPAHSLSAFRYSVNFQTWTSPNVVLNICGDEAQISVCSHKKPGLLTTICCVLEKHKIEVRSAHITSDCNGSMFMIHAHVSTGASNQFQELAFPAEAIYKQAAGEIMLWVSP